MEEKKEKMELPLMEGLFVPASREGQPRLIGSQCHACGKTFFPSRVICPHCFSDEKMEKTLLGPRGQIYAFTTVRISPPLGFDIPYSYGYVDLAKEGIRIPAMFTGFEPGQLRIGMDVTLVIDRLRTDKEGNEIIGYKFMPVAE